MADGALLMEPTPANIPIIAKFKTKYPMIDQVYRANLIKFHNSPYVQKYTEAVKNAGLSDYFSDFSTS